jgi:sulfopyruvate decarboxylase TPP-binding subunit
MVKAKDFFKVLCEELNYRFFSGVVCKGLAPLYKAMDESFMAYTPAINELTALGLCAGASISGLGSCMLFDMRFKEDMYSNFPFLLTNKLPVMLIGYSEKKEDFKYDIPVVYFKDMVDLNKLSKKIDKQSIPGLLIIGKEVFK